MRRLREDPERALLMSGGAFHGSASAICFGQTPENLEFRSRISPNGLTRTSNNSSPLGQDVAVRRMSSSPKTVYPISPSMQTGLAAVFAGLSGVFTKFRTAAILFTSDILNTWLSASVQPAESPMDWLQHRYLFSRFAFGSRAERSFR